MSILRKENLFYGALAVITIFATGCATHKIVVPPITQQTTVQYHPGKFVWHDLLTQNVSAAKKFYGGLFGWEFEAIDDTLYTLIKLNGNAIGGIVYSDLKKDVNESQWLSYLSVADVDKAVHYFEENDGQVLRKPWNLKARGRVAVVTDPQGALLVLIKSVNGDPPDKKPTTNDWLWDELLAGDTHSATSFYRNLIGYDEEIIDKKNERSYHILKYEEKPRAGVVKNPWPKVRPNWLPYVRVEDPVSVAKHAAELGGKIIFAPQLEVRKGSVGIIGDPTGAAVAIQKWPIEDPKGGE
ncbi:MAG: VOC family protein [Calditrichia bacterium]